MKEFPEANKPSLADEALSELKDEQPVIKEEALAVESDEAEKTEESLESNEDPLELRDEIEKSE